MTVYNAITIMPAKCDNINDVKRYVMMCIKSFGGDKFSFNELIDRLKDCNRDRDYITIFAGQSNKDISLGKESAMVNNSISHLIHTKQLVEVKGEGDAFYQNDLHVREHGVDPDTIKAPVTKDVSKGAA